MMTRRAPAGGKVTTVAVLVLVLCLCAPASAFAVASYVFEPTLSLTGNCAVSPLDEVPDPGLCPGTPNIDHPSAGFKSPSVATDAYGDIYVVNIVEKESRIDVFDAEGFFITEVNDPAGAQSIAVDSNGNMYLFERVGGGERRLVRYTPNTYAPKSKDIEYKTSAVVLADESTKPILSMSASTAVAVDPVTDRLYVDTGQNLAVFKSAEEGNGLLEAAALPVPEGSTKALNRSIDIEIDHAHGKIYFSDKKAPSTVRVFELEAPHNELKESEIDGSTTPAGQFISTEGFLTVAVDEDTGHVFVGDLISASKVYEFAEDGTYLATIQHSFEAVPFGEIAVDDGAFSPHPQTEGWLYVPSTPSPAQGHVYAFEPREVCAPLVESTSLSGITDTEAVLHAEINPCGLSTEYRLEYIAKHQYEEEKSFAKGTIAAEGTLPKGAEGVAVEAALTGLDPETAYVFGVFAQNEEGEVEATRAFKTFATENPPEPCANDAVRTGLSALLPDCRAYELVTPPSTNGRPPTGGFAGSYFPTLRAAPDGNRASFAIESGALPGSEGTGGFNGDLYVATRGTEGWSSVLSGPNGEEAPAPSPGSVSPDQTYSFWEGAGAVYLHYPDGHSELVGRGSIGEDANANVQLITEGAGHVIFVASEILEPDAPPTGTTAVYDRSAEGPTHVVSLLPGDVTPAAKENASYLGASEEGEGIAFKIAGTIYLRLHNEETFEVAGAGAKFAGVAEEGNRVFYLEGGDLFAFDAAAEETIAFSSSGDVTPVNVATGGARAYFVSPSILTGEPNPEGEEAEAGEENLYLSEEGTISFVGQVTERDVVGESTPTGPLPGLGLWIPSLEFDAPALDPSRTTPTGSTLLFESRADLTGFESEGFAQIYRYDSAEDRLDCLSCSPALTPPTSDARLQSVSSQSSLAVAGTQLKIPNQSPDGKRAFFETPEALVTGDTDGKLDVYEWEEGEVGGCDRPGGCIYLISSGKSPSPDYLFAMSSSGDDVFFRTADLLLPRDKEATLSIYDARVGGGFPEPEPPIPCAGESCRPLGFAPGLPEPTTTQPGPSEANPATKKCPKGRHKAKRHGKTICVKNRHKKAHHRHKTRADRRGGAR